MDVLQTVFGFLFLFLIFYMMAGFIIFRKRYRVKMGVLTKWEKVLEVVMWPKNFLKKKTYL